MKNIQIFLILFLFSFCVEAQNEASFLSTNTNGKVDIVQSAKMPALLKKYKSLSTENPIMDGYRIQIYFESGNNSKSLAEKEKQNFEKAYPHIPAYISFSQPNFRVRVGNFRTFIEAGAFQDLISEKYPNAFPVKEEIPLEKN